MSEGIGMEIRVCPGTECEVSRRAFLGATMTAVAALLAACGDGQIGVGGNPVGPVTPTEVRVADYPALARVGGIAKVGTGQGPVAVVRVSETAFSAYSMRCPHQGTTVNISGAAFVCPNHDARFTSAGVWTGGQRTSNLAPVFVAYDAATGVLTLSAGAGGGPIGGGDDEEEDEE